MSPLNTVHQIFKEHRFRERFYKIVGPYETRSPLSINVALGASKLLHPRKRP